MNFYLSAALARNRKGRFLQTVIGARPLEAEWPHSLPTSGLLLVQAEELTHSEALRALYQWAMQAGCAVLVIDPLAANLALLAKLSTPLDWRLAPAHINANESGVALILAGETNQALTGFSGSADRQQHMVGDIVHTRYIRKHSNSGVFAVTTLPLWSLNLLDHAEVLKSWLNWFVDHAGQATLITEKQPELAVYSPDKYDLVVLLLLYASNGKSLDKLVGSEPVKLVFDVNSLDITKRCEVLQMHGFINAAGLTESGRASLQASQYWAYAPLLIQQLSTGAR
ncbi:hypothetical protein [Rheinheimera tangshanensis]|uniref:DUF4123 domain-containing protein n=1 Tax=Rheinheimera tangshanensis TaxID=400153 RepID=A0A5C8M4K7_9GAMM|nr:hypothetical protein [Rheinheimera tangshanensis]TXK83293.1 hypothetical protein FU839_03195 [Rheinheimera tangshanensis]GGM44749.1 hypothetical protein GCM10010920_01280 [Rheinheimera tangshanensis]